MRVGVIGTGFGRRVVAPVFGGTPGCSVADVVSARDADGVAALCRRADVDLISVHSPPYLHPDHVRLALAAQKAVLCDKPFTLDPSVSARLLVEANAAGVVHLVNFEFRQHPARRRLKSLLDDGVVGPVEHVQWTHLSAGSRQPLRPYGWLFSRAHGGGWVGAWGSHSVDTVRWLFGEVIDTGAQLRTTVTQRPDRDGVVHDVDAEDGFTAWLTLDSGATVGIDTTFAAGAEVAPRIVVTGPDGVVELVGDLRLTVRRHGEARVEETIESGDGDVHNAPMQAWAEVVRDAVDRATPASPTFADGLACDAVLARWLNR
jgi:predicted dehydrogenase